MLGFDAEFTDTADFSRKITHRIWHERGVDLIRKYYAEDVIFRTSLNGKATGNAAVVANTLAVMNEFPDRRIYDEDFIWAEESPGVFYNSHRLFSKMIHLGDGMFGSATGAKLHAYTIADIMYRRNQAFNEYLVRDHLGIAQRIGVDVRTLAQQMAKIDREVGRKPPSADDWVTLWTEGSSSVPITGKAARYAKALEGAWGQAALRLIREHYHDECLSHGPGATQLRGHEDQERFVIGYLAAMPDATFRLHHWVERNDPGLPTRVSLRWSLQGRHTGLGRFGKPTDAPIVILAISQAELWGDRVMREWHGIDDLSLWKQIAGHQLSTQ
jgi:hypothetical protein